MASADMHPADRRPRRTTLGLIVGGAVAGALLIAAAKRVQPAVLNWIRADIPGRLRVALVATALVAVSPPFAGCIYLWCLGRRTLRARRFPPPGIAMVNDAVVMTGRAAERRGRLLQAFGLVLGIASILLAALLLRFLALLNGRRL